MAHLSFHSVIISRGTIITRESVADELIREVFSVESDYTSHIDFRSYQVEDDKKLIPIEQIRELVKEINIKPRISNKKVIWIKEAQNLSVEAQNALLKTLEEPPNYAHVILTVDHHDNLVKTVVSRCIIKDLNLSARIDSESDEYSDIKNEFLNLLSMNVGQKIDWVSENKSKIKDREKVLSLLDNWEAVLREEMLKAVDDNSNPDEWKDKIKLLQKIKRYIQSNANAALAVETLLLNI
jgi:DNA polymerase III delta prime subunit